MPWQAPGQSAGMTDQLGWTVTKKEPKRLGTSTLKLAWCSAGATGIGLASASTFHSMVSMQAAVGYAPAEDQRCLISQRGPVS